MSTGIVRNRTSARPVISTVYGPQGAGNFYAITLYGVTVSRYLLVGAPIANGSPMATPNADRRINPRYDIPLPIHYRVSQKGATSRWATSVTCDISSTGVSFRCRKRLPIGAHIEMVIDWPNGTTEVYATELVATGFVVRSSAYKSAVSMTSHRFRLELTPSAPMGATA